MAAPSETVFDEIEQTSCVFGTDTVIYADRASAT
jgi:hypothetical protein